MWSENFQMFKLDSENAEEPEVKLPSLWIIEKAREFQKNIYFCFTDYAKDYDCVGHNKLEILQELGYQTTLPASWETCMQVSKQQLELDVEQQIGFNLGKEYIKAVYCHCAYFTYMQRNAGLDEA